MKRDSPCLLIQTHPLLLSLSNAPVSLYSYTYPPTCPDYMTMYEEC